MTKRSAEPDGRFIHFVVNPHDPNLEYDKICQGLFGSGKCLAMLEDKKGKIKAPHVHIQGETTMNEVDLRAFIKELGDQHYERSLNKRHDARPVKRRTVEADDKGFQYMCKEDGREVLYKQVLTDQDMEDMHEASELHMDEVKNGLRDHLWLRCPKETSPPALHLMMRRLALAWYCDQDKFTPPNFQKLVLHAMAKCPWVTPDIFDYVAERI